MAKDDDIRKNGSGYYDPTAYKAIKKVENEAKNTKTSKKHKSMDFERYQKLIKLVYELCDLAGFRLENRIILVDKKTGRVWR